MTQNLLEDVWCITDCHFECDACGYTFDYGILTHVDTLEPVLGSTYIEKCPRCGHDPQNEREKTI